MAAPFRLLACLGRRFDLLPPQVETNRLNIFFGTLETLKQNNFINNRLVGGSTVVVISPNIVVILERIGNIIVMVVLTYVAYKVLSKLYEKSIYKIQQDRIRRLEEELSNYRTRQY